ncbi:MAG: GDSL-type esterase/lipase family protein [bacterium]|jgi:hypothetical protein
MRSRLAGFAINILIVCVALIVTLVAMEALIRIFRPQTRFAAIVNTWDREVGTRHICGGRGFVKTKDFKMDAIINSKGLRDREFAYEKREGIKRIIVLGDSFTFGYGVQADETFSKVLERILNAEGGGDETWEVLNMGVGSTGTAQQYALFLREGIKYDPDYVVLCFCQANDYWDNITCGLYTLEDGELVKHDAPKTLWRTVQQATAWMPGYRTLFASSHLLNFVKHRAARFHFRDLADKSDLPEGRSAVERRGEVVTQALVLAMCDACENRGCSLIMTVVPDPARGFIHHDDTIDLIDLAESHGIHFVSIAEALGKADAGGTAVIFGDDLHWNVVGHEIVGRTLGEFFLSQAAPEDRL